MELEAKGFHPPQNHGSMKPGHFETEARRIDDQLRVRYRDHGNRWVIYRIDPETGEWVLLRILETEDNEFLPLTSKFISDLRWGDTWRRPRGVEDILDHMQAKNQKIRDDSEAEIADAAEAAANDVANIGVKARKHFAQGAMS